MVAKALSTAAKPVEETFFQNEQVSVCLLVHRRAKVVRVIDFRAGPSLAKRAFVLDFAQREGLEKIYSLVERDEVATWVKLGFTREGSLPAFYKRSDAFLVGCVVKGARDRTVPLESETRLAIARPTASILEQLERASQDASDDDEGARPVLSAAHARMEKTLALAKKGAKALHAASDGLEKAPAVKLAVLPEDEAKRKVAACLKTQAALSGFEPFGRDVARSYFALTSKAIGELVASVETQSCFGSALVELLTGPKTEREALATAAAVRALVTRMIASDLASCFAFVPSDDVALASAFVANGFRRTGLLEQHLVARGARKDAILFTRKLSTTGD